MSRKSDSHDDRPPGFQPRRSARVSVGDQAASLNPDNVYAVEIKVQNVSSAGFMAECAAPVRIGSYVSLDIPGIGPVQAQVRWQIGAKMGGMFLDPISLAHCEWTAVKAEAA
ncbi:MAG TPA: hypothetical protein VMS43_17125 [Allosphingosinicella sp.]|nr:hypothetical protein [Allosphingosinicella sp.]